MVENLTKETFLNKVFNFEKNKEWKFEGTKPCVIDFYADWCGPCKMMSPVFDELSNEYDGKIDVYKINTETEPELASAFGVRSIPSILFVPLEGQPQMSIGAAHKVKLKNAFENIIGQSYPSS